MHRRQFVASSLAALSLGALPRFARAMVAPAQKPLKLLILGGTAFLGPQQAGAVRALGPIALPEPRVVQVERRYQPETAEAMASMSLSRGASYCLW